MRIEYVSLGMTDAGDTGGICVYIHSMLHRLGKSLATTYQLPLMAILWVTGNDNLVLERLRHIQYDDEKSSGNGISVSVVIYWCYDRKRLPTFKTFRCSSLV